MLPLFVLLWGHLIVRKRRYIHTPFEMIYTVIGVLFLFSVREILYMINDLDIDFENITELALERDERPVERVSVPSMVYYSPVTGATRRLMQQVGQKLGLREIQQVPDGFDFRGIHGVQNVSHNLPRFSEKLGNHDAFITFENASSLPLGHLNYTIRVKSDIHRPQRLAGTLYERFLRLQWAIDASFIERRSDTALPKHVTFQEVDAKVKKKLNNAVFLIVALLMVFCRFLLTIPFVNILSKYTEEKVTGHHELLKMNGVPMRTVIAGHLLNMLPTGLFFTLFSTMFLKITDTPLIPHTIFIIIALVYFLHYYAMMLWALLCSFVINTESYITSKASLMSFALMIPTVAVDAFTMPRAALVFFGCFVPFLPLDKFYVEVLSMDPRNKGIDFSNMWTAHGKKQTISTFEIILCLVTQLLLLSALVLWLARVRPGPYGVAEPCTATIPFYNKIKKRKDDSELEQVPIPRDPKYFENPPNKEVGIKICNVSKVFGVGAQRYQALTNVSFDIYRGEIMVLLGHNGAGKTTLLSIVTGMIPATSGKVYVSGQDIDKSRSKMRKEMGYCTQHNTFMSYLTIQEQVRFWSMLKGQGYKEAKRSSHLLLEELKIDDKANHKSQQLSGGMKRRLQLACALAGGSTVLILDEPTSGLDVETRRQLWDLLLTLRGTRTMVLTTHYMEEADALGDRVAALHQGILKCHATPMHLKNNIGSGYRLTIMTRGPPKEAEITTIVTTEVSGASLKDKTTIQVTYDLPASETAKFPQLFEKLEGQQTELDIESMGVSMASLEEVFLRLCSNVDTELTEDKEMTGMQMANYEKITGFALLKNQAIVLFKRHFYFMLENKWSYLIWNILIPIALIIAMIYMHYVHMAEVRKKSDNATRRSGLSSRLRRPVFSRRAFDSNALYRPEDEMSINAMADSRTGVKFSEIRDEEDEAFKKGKMQLIHNDNYLAGLLLNSTHAKIMFKRGMYDAASIALNLLSNTLAAEQDGGTRRAIHTSQRPVTTVQFLPQLPKPTEIADMKDVQSLMIFLGAVFCIMMATASAISSRERQTGVRIIYMMSGCSVPIFWIVRLIYFLLFYTLVLLLPVVVAFLCLKPARMMWTFEPLAVLAISFWCSCCAWLSFVFLFGLFVSERIVTFVALAIVLIFGVLAPNMLHTSGSGEISGTMGNIVKILTYGTYVMTPGTFNMVLTRTGEVALANAYCEVNRHLCPLLMPMPKPFDYVKCCVGKENMADYFSFSEQSPLLHVLLLILQFVVFMTLLLLSDSGFFHKCKLSYKQPPPQFSDPLVNAEKAYVRTTFDRPRHEIKDVMLVNNLHKKFCTKSPAVRGVSFSVKQGECFGVLGVNGTGKTTTFKMIVGDISSSVGACYANKHFLDSERKAYLRSLSYCPQFLGLDTYMTGYQNLTTLLTIRGLNKQDMEKEINLCFDVVGLQQYRNKKVSEYSGGCMRRLAAGTALSSGAAVTLLDEPTCGVDVAARRRVWTNIKQSLQQGRAVIITSHSMDEMETLSNRLMIMACGEVRLLGSPGALRASHAAGHAVILKLVSAVPADGGAGVQELKAEMNRIFNCTLKDEHQTMLHYHINENKTNSVLFREMENLKAKFNHLIEDYSVSATSLEEVFLAIAQETSALPQPTNKKNVKVEIQKTKGKKDQKVNKEEKEKKKRTAEMCESCEDG